ncbi:FH2 domain-containing protein 1-like [Syngnathoides biaculeatus]|uniref:FH2 domain-containing protein 1-like n=1 Tax=Syngnathoides biaculeatus TaxID=300417 RepID=UPI002ADE2029|nr:FH2 domain-containing protein 1-like [Syngnathoides biaculeatus]XP_061683755.1 FH2 domain-containing protein 1-like [Syngnathoides biaculeatus]XP_061683756.1 FH2 domain-containing protein 1-like [Syngnathoides biaculeatus]XP_061683757.1 FH2 domain-containing protein 1-like [Syngnathoides biaculeatus]XP_061683758.1 FH2 domain-containing protein 1-like [Syngnathoides biaculeatus]XP_061683759.1 FH2 domain-containing protein 1-like [Syngnathoides biaculeatus]XP_061683760.1 FH2 domain-containin
MERGDPPLPPPPPPPLLPPPPPPPPPPGLGGSRLERRRSRMRNFNWETIPKHTVMGKRNIWTEDRPDGDYELDTEHMEELFSHKRAQQQNQLQLAAGGPPAPSAGELVSILSAKRSMNIGIFLKQFRRPVTDMIEDIRAGNGRGFGPGKLRELCKLLPDDDEVKELLKFDGNQSALPDADLFMRMLVQIPGYEERLSSLVLKDEFFPFMSEMRGFIDTLKAAGNELLDSDSLHAVIRLVLKTGNYMNAGGYAGSAVGFRMASLLKLVDTKANKPGMNLMHYVVMQAQNADVALLDFPKHLAHIKDAARINQSDIETEFDRQVKKVNDAKANTLKQEDLRVQMEDFLKDAETCLDEVERDLQVLQSTSDSVAQYFCEDPSKFRLEECCSIFDSFCERFLRAVQENTAREVAEVKRRHRNRLQSPAKRRSTATCSVRDKEMEGIALESILQNFLTNRLQRRRSGRPSSTHGSPVNGSPQSGSLSEISSQADFPRLKGVGPPQASVTERKKEWNSAVELAKTPHQQADSSDSETDVVSEKDQGGEIVLSAVGESSSRTPSISSSARSFSAATDIDDDDLQDNNEEEAQKLREASKKVLLYQNSQSSISSAEFSVETPKSPRKRGALSRRRTFDMESDRYPGDPTNEELVRLLLSSPPSSNCDIPRRHTLPMKVKKKEEIDDEDEVWVPVSAATDTDQKTACKSKQVFDFTDLPQKQGSQSTKNLAPMGQDKEQGHGENGETVPPESSWSTPESSGLFYGFLKRLGDIGRLQTSTETTQQGVGTDV